MTNDERDRLVKFFNKILKGFPDLELESAEEIFEFREEQGFLVARQKYGAYIPTEPWFQIYNFTVEHGGEMGKDHWGWFFRFPKASALDRSIEKPREVDAGKPSGETVKPGYYAEFPVDRILSNPFSFRVNIEEGIDELMAEIHAAGMIIEPLVGRPKRGYVEVGPGERRLYAAKQMRMKTVPIIVKEFSDAEFDRIRFLENLARKDLTDMETARALKHMLGNYPEKYPTHEDLARAFGRDRTWVTHHLRMLELEMDEKFVQNVSRDTLNRLTEYQTRMILSAPPNKRSDVARWITKKVEETGEIPGAREIRGFVQRLVGSKPVEVPVEEPEVPAEEEEKPSIPCDRCGKSVTVPVHIRGKFYCEDCAAEILVPTKPSAEEKPMEAKTTLNKSVVLEALEKTLFTLHPEGVELEKIRSELEGEGFGTSNLSDLLFELTNEGTIALEKGRFMPRREYEREQTLDRLRTEIRAAEEDLISKYEGFRENQGLETYKVLEIRRIAKRNGPTREFLGALRRCVDLQKEFYRVYNRQQSFAALKNDVATVNIERIDRYLRSAKPKPVKPPVDWKAMGKFCPVCKTLLSERTYERLKRKFTGEIADKIAEKFEGKVPSVREIFKELFK